MPEISELPPMDMAGEDVVAIDPQEVDGLKKKLEDQLKGMKLGQ